MKTNTTLILLAIVLVSFAVFLGVQEARSADDERNVMLRVFASTLSAQQSGLTETGAVIAPIGATVGSCPTDGDTSFKLEVQNLLNTSGAEEYDVTAYLLGSDGGVVDTISDTTDPTAVTITCGEVYSIAVIAADGASGDSSEALSIMAKPSGSDAKVVDGNLVFTADRSNMYIKVGMEQHGTLQFKLYDNEDARYSYDTGDSSNTAWEATGVTFTDGDNTTAFAVGAAGYIDFTARIQGIQVDTDPMDAYILLALEAPVTVWAEPSIKWNGKTLTDISESIDDDASKALSSYEYVYKITGDIENDIHDLDVYMEALSGQDPSADIEFDFYTAGNYLKTDNSGIMESTHKDDSARTAVYTKQEFTVDIS